MKEDKDERQVSLYGRWLNTLIREIEDADYCFVCGEHPSHGHQSDCPMKELAS